VGAAALITGATCLRTCWPSGGGARRRMVRFGPGDATVEFGDEGSGAVLQPLRSSADVLASGDHEQLRANLARDGYLYLPGALPREDVLAAKALVLEDFAGRAEGVLDAARPIAEAVLKEGCAAGCVPFLEGRNPVTHHPKMLAVLEGVRCGRPSCRALGCLAGPGRGGAGGWGRRASGLS
jgi:hypothetical protein